MLKLKRYLKPYIALFLGAIILLFGQALLELTLPFVRVGGRAIAWKGPGLQAELEQARRAAHLLGGALEGVLDAPVPGRDWQHVLLVCAKRQKTARQYPRRAGLPGKNPLG